MYKGEPSEGVDFYFLLFESDEFTSELGKVALASGKLEAELMLLLKRNGIKENYEKATLGRLIDIAEKNKLLNRNLTIALKETSKQRNYLTHNIYSLFIDLIDETILEKKNLLDSDVHTYLEKAWQLKENLIGLADIIQNIIETVQIFVSGEKSIIFHQIYTQKNERKNEGRIRLPAI